MDNNGEHTTERVVERVKGAVLGFLFAVAVISAMVGGYSAWVKPMVFHTPTNLVDEGAVALMVCENRADFHSAAVEVPKRRTGIWYQSGPKNDCRVCLETEAVYSLRGRLLCPGQ